MPNIFVMKPATRYFCWVAASTLALCCFFPRPIHPAENSSDIQGILTVLERYIRANYARDYTLAYSCISAQDQRLKDERTYARERGAFEGFTLEAARRLAGYVEMTLLERRIDGGRAYVKVDLKAPDPEKIAPRVHGWDSERLERMSAAERKALLDTLEALHMARQLELHSGAETFELVKDGGQWKVFLNWAAGKKVTFQTALPPSLPVEARVQQQTVTTRTGENFTIVLRLKNNSKQEISTRVGHLVDPFEFRDYLDLIECGFLYPVKLPPGKEEEFTATYRIRDTLPDSVRQLSVTYELTAAK
jgi:Cytochrome c oxidase assembly protein CtaG/Cox11